jgi:hypothetical protein
VAAVGTVVAIEQERLGTIENQATEQQSLVSIVGNLAQLSQQEAKGSDIAVLHEAGAADADQGIALVQDLHNDVPAIDNLELGAAFEAYGAYHDALISFNRAAAVTNTDPVYRSKALRAAAAVNYYIGGRSHVLAARTDTAMAYAAFDGQPDVPVLQLYQNKELADLWDAIFAASSDCGRAEAELSQAEGFLSTDPSSEDPAVRGYLVYAREHVQACRVARPLAPNRPSVPAS